MTLLLLAACTFEEALPEVDLTGTVVVPREAVTRTVVTYGGLDENESPIYTTSEVTDPRLIGPVILGAFSGIDAQSFDYPHPTMGPIITSDTPGDAYPYGGTTVGRLDFACYEALKCKVTTGRFTDFEDVLDYFTNMMGVPVTDSTGEIVDYPSTFQQHCYEYFEYTTDSELDFLGPDELDFAENGDGDFEASFILPHTQYVPGMVLWGWMDAPTISTENPDVNGGFSTCDQTEGRNYEEYDQEYEEGRFGEDLLNLPSFYIFDGDWVADGTTLVTDEDPDDGTEKSYTVTLSHPVVEE